MAIFTVSEVFQSLSENPAGQNREWPVATWTLGADSRADALRIVRQTINESARDLMRTPDGFEVWEGRHRDFDGYKNDDYRRWTVARG